MPERPGLASCASGSGFFAGSPHLLLAIFQAVLFLVIQDGGFLRFGCAAIAITLEKLCSGDPLGSGSRFLLCGYSRRQLVGYPA
jgi:hypothetical protein